MNVFEHLAKYGNDNKFQGRTPTDPTPNWLEVMSESERMKQVQARVERGEDPIHPDEFQRFMPKRDNSPITDYRPGGGSNAYTQRFQATSRLSDSY